ncbi:MAG: hypothetical protein QOG07_3818, partial [Pseudonocardiales bacterium]|nr:hypothetical protein [Pseudonocardiales bacterium]
SAPGRRHARFRAAAERLVVYVIGVPIAVVLGVAFAVHFHVGTGADPPASVHRPAPAIPSPFIQVSTVPAAPAGNFGPTFQVPDTAHVGSNGMATVICQPSPGAAGYTINVRPGALIACTNGATPFVLN